MHKQLSRIARLSALAILPIVWNLMIPRTLSAQTDDPRVGLLCERYMDNVEWYINNYGEYATNPNNQLVDWWKVQSCYTAAVAQLRYQYGMDSQIETSAAWDGWSWWLSAVANEEGGWDNMHALLETAFVLNMAMQWEAHPSPYGFSNPIYGMSFYGGRSYLPASGPLSQQLELQPGWTTAPPGPAATLEWYCPGDCDDHPELTEYQDPNISTVGYEPVPVYNYWGSTVPGTVWNNIIWVGPYVHEATCHQLLVLAAAVSPLTSGLYDAPSPWTKIARVGAWAIQVSATFVCAGF